MRALPALLLLVAMPAAPARAETVGECGFDRATLSFAGPPLAQATCLLRQVELLGAKQPQHLPRALRALITGGGGPSGAMRDAALAAFPEPYATFARAQAAAPVSRTAAGLPARYFVIHDTSTPFLGDAPFPRWLDRDPAVNAFAPYLGPEPVAHVFLNRAGQIWAGHDFAQAWRATKLESRVIGPAARGRFLHIETVQPRRLLPGFHDDGHTRGPSPGFSAAQYRMLAALYVYASARAGQWLIPAFHATVDAGIPDAHDDPQNFRLKRFAREVALLVAAR